MRYWNYSDRTLTRAWLSDPKSAIYYLTLPIIWNYIGLYMIIFVAALQNIPSEIDDSVSWMVRDSLLVCSTLSCRSYGIRLKWRLSCVFRKFESFRFSHRDDRRGTGSCHMNCSPHICITIRLKSIDSVMVVPYRRDLDPKPAVYRRQSIVNEEKRRLRGRDEISWDYQKSNMGSCSFFWPFMLYLLFIP